MAQAVETVLAGWDSAAARSFRQEQRAWRGEDLGWRALSVAHAKEKTAQRELFSQWRAYCAEQLALDNCRTLWARYLERHRRDVEEAIEKLKVLAQLGALTAGFAVSAFYDFQYSASPDDPVLPVFGLATALTVGVELNSCVLSTLMLSAVAKVSKSYIGEEEEAEFMWRAREWAAAMAPGSVPPAPRRDFRRHWQTRCEGRWRTALWLFLSGIPTFFSLLALAGYLKFQSSPATVVVTAVLMAAAFVYTVAMSGDWAKALLVGPTSDADMRDWQGGAWWRSAEASEPLPFGYHLPPDKDSVWPLGGGVRHDGVRRPYGRSLEELPYPAIIGLQPWPTAAAAAGDGGVGGGGELAAPPAPGVASGTPAASAVVSVGYGGRMGGAGVPPGVTRAHGGVDGPLEGAVGAAARHAAAAAGARSARVGVPGAEPFLGGWDANAQQQAGAWTGAASSGAGSAAGEPDGDAAAGYSGRDASSGGGPVSAFWGNVWDLWPAQGVQGRRVQGGAWSLAWLWRRPRAQGPVHSEGGRDGSDAGIADAGVASAAGDDARWGTPVAADDGASLAAAAGSTGASTAYAVGYAPAAVAAAAIALRAGGGGPSNLHALPLEAVWEDSEQEAGEEEEEADEVAAAPCRRRL